MNVEWANCTEVEYTPGKVGGAWVFRGTRIPVRALFDNIEDGASLDDFLEWFPGVTRQQAEGVLECTTSWPKISKKCGQVRDALDELHVGGYVEVQV